jgi:hypothetical protein
MTESSTQDWPERNWAVAILGALVGLAIQQLADGKMDDVLRAALEHPEKLKLEPMGEKGTPVASVQA